MEAFANGKSLGKNATVSGDDYVLIQIPLQGNAAWKGKIESLEIGLSGGEGTFVEIDTIEVIR